jgi:hypothetical protein
MPERGKAGTEILIIGGADVDGQPDDVKAIRAVVARQFGSLNWTTEKPGNWDAFQSDFFPGASLYPAARPAKPQSVAAFVERMAGLSQTTLHTFGERVLGAQIRVFGNVAAAIVAAEMTENGTTITRNVEMMLLVKDEGAWRIVSQVWDRASDMRPVPDDLLGGFDG